MSIEEFEKSRLVQSLTLEQFFHVRYHRGAPNTLELIDNDLIQEYNPGYPGTYLKGFSLRHKIPTFQLLHIFCGIPKQDYSYESELVKIVRSFDMWVEFEYHHTRRRGPGKDDAFDTYYGYFDLEHLSGKVFHRVSTF